MVWIQSKIVDTVKNVKNINSWFLNMFFILIPMYCSTCSLTTNFLNLHYFNNFSTIFQPYAGQRSEIQFANVKRVENFLLQHFFKAYDRVL